MLRAGSVVNAGGVVSTGSMVGDMPMATAMMPRVRLIAGEHAGHHDGGQTDSTIAKPVLGFGTHSEHRAPRP